MHTFHIDYKTITVGQCQHGAVFTVARLDCLYGNAQPVPVASRTRVGARTVPHSYNETTRSESLTDLRHLDMDGTTSMLYGHIGL